MTTIIEKQVKDINRISKYINDFSKDSSNIEYDIDELEDLVQSLLCRVDIIRCELASFTKSTQEEIDEVNAHLQSLYAL